MDTVRDFILYLKLCNRTEYHLAVQTVTGWVKKAQIIGTDVTGKPVTRAQFNAMQKEVARLKEENEILKIAAVLLGEHRK
ncbi:MAG: hypothetical protein L0I45_09545 [Lactococcus lactis]|nr:hypothetical protein [Lactococcus lactis]